MERDVGPMDELEEVCIDEQNTAKVIKIEKNLEAVVRALLVEFPRRNLDVVAWPHSWLRPMQEQPQLHHLRRRHLRMLQSQDLPWKGRLSGTRPKS